MPNLVVVAHPLVQHKLTLMRMRQTPVAEFRRLVREVALLIGYEITRDLPLTETAIETPLMPMQAPLLAGKKVCLISILRAGNGLLDGMLDLMPSARVGHIGLYRDPATLQPVEYYYKVPQDIAERPVILVDPMLATANSAVAAVSRVKRDGVAEIKDVAFEATDAMEPSGSSVAAILEDGANVWLERCDFIAGDGASASFKPRLPSMSMT